MFSVFFQSNSLFIFSIVGWVWFSFLFSFHLLFFKFGLFFSRSIRCESDYGDEENWFIAMPSSLVVRTYQCDRIPREILVLSDLCERGIAVAVVGFFCFSFKVLWHSMKISYENYEGNNIINIRTKQNNNVHVFMLQLKWCEANSFHSVPIAFHFVISSEHFLNHSFHFENFRFLIHILFKSADVTESKNCI